MDIELYNLHFNVKLAQSEKDARMFKSYHKAMVKALQQKLTRNIKQKTNICTLMVCEPTFKPNILLKVLEEYREMDLEKHKKLSKYKFKASDRIFNCAN